MSKKIWNRIFKSKGNKPQQHQQIAKINKRNSRLYYEDYQQLNELLGSEKSQLALPLPQPLPLPVPSRFGSEHENENQCGKAGSSSTSAHINVFEQQPEQSSFNSMAAAALSEAQQLQQTSLQLQQQQQMQQPQQQQLSTFSRVRNTFSLKRSKRLTNPSNATPADGSGSISESGMSAADAGGPLERVLIVVNKIECAAPANATATNSSSKLNSGLATKTNLHGNPMTDGKEIATIDNQQDHSLAVAPPPPPGQLTTVATIENSKSENTLTPCPNCSRTFNLNALRKHVTICEKLSKKRNIFDSSRQRREGTTLETYVLPKNFGLPNAERAAGVHTPPPLHRVASDTVSGAPQLQLARASVSPSPMRRKSQGNTELVRSTVRTSMRKHSTDTQGQASAAHAVPAATSLTRERLRSSERSMAKRIHDAASDRCPHCDRTFNPKAFDRHVEWCKEKAIQATIKLSTSEETNKAKERLEARKQYKPPNLKTKRSSNRNKYAGVTQDEQQLVDNFDMVSTTKQSRSLSSMNSSVNSDNIQLQLYKTTNMPRRDTQQSTDSRCRKSKIEAGESTADHSHVGSRDPEGPALISSRRGRYNKKKPYNTCDLIDDTLQHVRRASSTDIMQLATLECVEAAPLQPAMRRRGNDRRKPNRMKVEEAERQINLPPMSAAMIFDEFNGVMKRKGQTTICNLQMSEENKKLLMPEVKTRNSTSLVRQARRRMRTREHPKLEMRFIQQDQQEYNSSALAIDAPSPIKKNAKISTTVFESGRGHRGNRTPLPLIYATSEQHQKIQHPIYDGSDDSSSPCGEIQFKLESKSTTAIACRPQKRAQTRARINSSEPMRALPMPQLEQDLSALTQTMSQTVLPRLDLKRTSSQLTLDFEEDEDFDASELELDYMEPDEVEHSNAKQSLTSLEADEDESEEDHFQSRRLQHKQNSSNSISRRLVVLEEDENGVMYITPQPKSISRPNSVRGHNKSGLSSICGSDKYDPFLSAKRQLEELCSPSGLPDDLLPSAPPPPIATTEANTTRATPQSLLSSFTMPSSVNKSPSILTSSTLKPSSNFNTPSSTSTSSNFRRTSSLRAPRRTSLLPSRPLFATNYRPTIQRGLSDEGPISSNFLKPEEFDEIPVRAACGNDFHSPRVVRRENSAIANRKQQQQLKLSPSTSDAPQQMDSRAEAQRGVAKTDSLAVFLKYEHELEQLNAKAAELNSKELKDKSNNLSKQNSAKSIKLEALTTTTTASPVNTTTTSSPLNTPTTMSSQLPMLVSSPSVAVSNSSNQGQAKENIENRAYNFATPLRLEPIMSKPLAAQQQQTQLPLLDAPASMSVKLNSIFGPNRLERKLSSGSDYIDPKLINPCDNLHVPKVQGQDEINHSHATSKTISQSSSQSTITQLCIDRRSSTEGRNLLKRKMRLGRNQFLYDASPEAADCSSSCCSADDEGNRSSIDCDEQKSWKQTQANRPTNIMPEKLQQPQQQHPLTKMMPLTMPIMPTFDDFDFEEFLSSFENDDDEQFPLFKDCRDFLLNRTTSRQRSLLKANSTPHKQPPTQPQESQKPQLYTTHRFPHSPSPCQTAATQFLYNNNNAPTAALRSESNGSNSGNGDGSYNLSNPDEQLRREPSNISSNSSDTHEKPSSNKADEKREIFISIETEPNALGRSPISPDSLRHMVGNAQTPIELVEIHDGNEPEHAKFSKISDTDEDTLAEADDDDVDVGTNHKGRQTSASTSPTKGGGDAFVEKENAKNLLGKLQDEFVQLGKEAGASMRRALLIRGMSNEEPQLHEYQQRQQQQPQPSQPLPQQSIDGTKVRLPLPHSGDSDELSSLDGYPISASRCGASSKLSNDSAYGSNSPYCLSRQRSSELATTPRTQQANKAPPVSSPPQRLMRPHTATGGSNTNNSMVDASTQAHSGFGTLKARQRLFSASGGMNVVRTDGSGESSSSSSNRSSTENLMAGTSGTTQTNYINYQQQQNLDPQQIPQQQQQSAYNNNNNNIINNTYSMLQDGNGKNNNMGITADVTPTTSQHSLISSTSVSSTLSASMKVSKFCHECGARFIVETAKFCMDCGVRRMVLESN